MYKSCAICLRGKCLDNNLNCKNNKLEKIDYKKYIHIDYMLFYPVEQWG